MRGAVVLVCIGMAMLLSLLAGRLLMGLLWLAAMLAWVWLIYPRPPRPRPIVVTEREAQRLNRQREAQTYRPKDGFLVDQQQQRRNSDG